MGGISAIFGVGAAGDHTPIGLSNVDAGNARAVGTSTSLTFWDAFSTTPDCQLTARGSRGGRI